jgi:hypothetical protein
MAFLHRKDDPHQTFVPSCGECSACCTTLGVPELEKAPGERCKHLKPTGGCGIYDTRPASCRDFECMFLQVKMPTKFRPDKLKVVISGTKDGEKLVFHQTHNYLPREAEEVLQKLVQERKQTVIVIPADQGTRKMLMP